MDRIFEDKLPGVGCEVVTCKYHSKDNRCYATAIKVESHNAVKKGETFCGTFTPASH